MKEVKPNTQKLKPSVFEKKLFVLPLIWVLRVRFFLPCPQCQPGILLWVLDINKSRVWPPFCRGCYYLHHQNKLVWHSESILTLLLRNIKKNFFKYWELLSVAFIFSSFIGIWRLWFTARVWTCDLTQKSHHSWVLPCAIGLPIKKGHQGCQWGVMASP